MRSGFLNDVHIAGCHCVGTQARASARRPKHLSKLLAERLVVIDPGFGIEVAYLTASWVEALTEHP